MSECGSWIIKWLLFHHAHLVLDSLFNLASCWATCLLSIGSKGHGEHKGNYEFHWDGHDDFVCLFVCLFCWSGSIEVDLIVVSWDENWQEKAYIRSELRNIRASGQRPGKSEKGAPCWILNASRVPDVREMSNWACSISINNSKSRWYDGMKKWEVRQFVACWLSQRSSCAKSLIVQVLWMSYTMNAFKDLFWYLGLLNCPSCSKNFKHTFTVRYPSNPKIRMRQMCYRHNTGTGRLGWVFDRKNPSVPLGCVSISLGCTLLRGRGFLTYSYLQMRGIWPWGRYLVERSNLNFDCIPRQFLELGLCL